MTEATSASTKLQHRGLTEIDNDLREAERDFCVKADAERDASMAKRYAHELVCKLQKELDAAIEARHENAPHDTPWQRTSVERSRAKRGMGHVAETVA